MNVWYINSILGAICLEEENDALCGVHFCPDGAPELEPLPRRVVETPLLQEAEEQLNEYFAGVRREFDLPLAAKGTPFQQAVWAQLRKIPYGEVRTYGQLAAALGKPKASRAVGSACHRNPLCIVVPCHRVIGADGSLTATPRDWRSRNIYWNWNNFKRMIKAAAHRLRSSLWRFMQF